MNVFKILIYIKIKAINWTCTVNLYKYNNETTTKENYANVKSQGRKI